MNEVDASDHFKAPVNDETPSVCVVIIDTNPRAWATLAAGNVSGGQATGAEPSGRSAISLSHAIANLLVFVNAHLALSAANRVAMIASHCNRAVWLFPPSSDTAELTADVTMRDVASAQDASAPTSRSGEPLSNTSANKFPPFAQVESAVVSSLRALVDSTHQQDVASLTTSLSGALSMALCYLNKAAVSMAASRPAPADGSSLRPSASAAPTGPLCGRIFVLSVSDSEPSQYIPTMNTVFAAAHTRIPIDVLSLAGEATFMQQAAFITGGTFVSAAACPPGLLAYLMVAFAADASARSALVAPAHPTVDLRAACFCHGHVVSDGFVCSICLSIFCDIPNPPDCPTCSTTLAVGFYGAKPAVIPRKNKKKRTAQDEDVRGGSGILQT